MKEMPPCVIHGTRYGAAYVITLKDWIGRAAVDTNGLVANVVFREELLDFDGRTDLSHAMIGNIRYEITRRERVEGGWKLWLYAPGEEVAGNAAN